MIKLSWLADKFASYYWPLVMLRIRQATDPSRDPVIMRFIRERLERMKLSSNLTKQQFCSSYPEAYAGLVKACCQRGGCFDEVIPRFHTVRHRQTSPILYKYDLRHGRLILSPGVFKFLHEYRRVLHPLAIGAWVRFTEQFSFAPHLYDKIKGVRPQRRHKRYRVSLTATQRSQCFYCRDDLKGSFHIDHVIPWSFVYEDKYWNLVLACGSCNAQKLDRVPKDHYLKTLIRRNSDLIESIATAKETGLRRESLRDLREFETRDLRKHIRLIAANCREEGFGTWSGPTIYHAASDA